MGRRVRHSPYTERVDATSWPRQVPPLTPLQMQLSQVVVELHPIALAATPSRRAVAARRVRAGAEASRAVILGVAEALVNAMEAKDPFLRGHSQRVAALAAAVARELGLDVATVEAIHTAGRVHDVGKIGIRESVLLKRGALTAEEYAHIQTHVQIGVDILSPIRDHGPVRDYVHHHHERFDGGGYPQGLRGHEISIGGRVLAAVDVFDALTSVRPYREPLAPGDALAELSSVGGRQLDPEVLVALQQVVRGGTVAGGIA